MRQVRGATGRGRRAAHTTTIVATALVALAACGGGKSSPAGTDGGIVVTATEDSCQLSSTTTQSGPHTFTTVNKGRSVNEVYVYAGDAILGEAANIGPGLSQELTVELPAGDIDIACKPGGAGDGIRSRLTVSKAEGAQQGTASDPILQTAVAAYREYVEEQADTFVARTAEFTAAVKAGDVAKAKRLYAVARQPWERIEPVAETFGDLDPRIDARQGDVPDSEWGGYHRIEKALWQDNSLDGMGPVADQLLLDAKEVQNRVATVELTAAQLANGANELLTEVSTTKVTGEEERYSRTDLVDFAANVKGSRQAYSVLGPAVSNRDAALAEQIRTRFDAVEAALAVHASPTEPGGFVHYTALSEAQVKDLARAVDALAEPLSKVTATVVGRA